MIHLLLGGAAAKPSRLRGRYGTGAGSSWLSSALPLDIISWDRHFSRELKDALLVEEVW